MTKRRKRKEGRKEAATRGWSDLDIKGIERRGEESMTATGRIEV